MPLCPNCTTAQGIKPNRERIGLGADRPFPLTNQTIVTETDRNSAIETAREKLATRFGNALENAEVEVAEEV